MVAVVAALPLAIASAPSAAEPAQRIVVLADGPGKLVDDAVAGLAKDGRAVSVHVVDGAPLVDDGAVMLAAGPRSARALAASTVAHKAAFLVKSADAPAGIASVSLDAPLTAQLAWIKLAFPGRQRVIVPRSHVDDDAKLKDAAAAAALTLTLVDVKSAGEAVPAVDAALKRGGAAVILLVPDALAVTSDTVAPLVQAALAARAPVVGFSPYFLKVGALAAVSVDAAAMARQALALATSTTTGVVAPDSGHLVVDGRLAERLGVAVHDGPGVEVRR